MSIPKQNIYVNNTIKGRSVSTSKYNFYTLSSFPFLANVVWQCYITKWQCPTDDNDEKTNYEVNAPIIEQYTHEAVASVITSASSTACNNSSLSCIAFQFSIISLANPNSSTSFPATTPNTFFGLAISLKPTTSIVVHFFNQSSASSSPSSSSSSSSPPSSSFLSSDIRQIITKTLYGRNSYDNSGTNTTWRTTTLHWNSLL